MENVIEKHHKTMNEKMRDNWPILEQACGNAGLIKKCVQIPQDAGHLTGLHELQKRSAMLRLLVYKEAERRSKKLQ